MKVTYEHGRFLGQLDSQPGTVSYFVSGEAMELGGNSVATQHAVQRTYGAVVVEGRDHSLGGFHQTGVRPPTAEEVEAFAHAVPSTVAELAQLTASEPYYRRQVLVGGKNYWATRADDEKKARNLAAGVLYLMGKRSDLSEPQREAVSNARRQV